MTRRLNNSYQKLYRYRHVVATQLKLTDAEYRLWDLLIALKGWDKNYPDSYRIVETTDREIAGILRWSCSKVCRTRNKLQKKDLVTKKAIRVCEVNDASEMQHLISIVQQKGAKPKQKVAPTQQGQVQINTSPLVSYKGESGFLRSQEEYQKTEEELGPDSLEIDDMKWIDANV